jgi:hypothetical protein
VTDLEWSRSTISTDVAPSSSFRRIRRSFRRRRSSDSSASSQESWNRSIGKQRRLRHTPSLSGMFLSSAFRLSKRRRPLRLQRSHHRRLRMRARRRSFSPFLLPPRTSLPRSRSGTSGIRLALPRVQQARRPRRPEGGALRRRFGTRIRSAIGRSSQLPPKTPAQVVHWTDAYTPQEMNYLLGWFFILKNVKCLKTTLVR